MRQQKIISTMEILQKNIGISCKCKWFLVIRKTYILCATSVFIFENDENTVGMIDVDLQEKEVKNILKICEERKEKSWTANFLMLILKIEIP